MSAYVKANDLELSQCRNIKLIVAPLAFFDVVRGPRRHMVAVVSAAITVLLNFIAICPSDKRPCLYASGAAKNERRIVDWTMRWATRVKSRA